MKPFYNPLILLVAIAAVLAPWPLVAQPAEQEREVLYWYDPMYPQQRFDQPGPSPFMDMDLVPRYAEPDAGGDGPPAMRIDPDILQNLGVRLAPVTRGPVEVSITATGQLSFNQRDVAVVQARSQSFVERVYGLAEQDLVERGTPLADLLVPEWAAAQQEYLALRGLDEPRLLEAARQRMRLAGMPESLVDQVARHGKVQLVWTLTSPVGGVIQSLDVREGMTLAAGATLARINGLETVWLVVEVPEAQVAGLQAGQGVEAQLPAYPGETLQGEIQAVLPQANRDSRTVPVRIELSNAEQRLRPGMTAKVMMARQEDAALLVPTEALIRTGRRTLVMVAEEGGRFRPVEVRTGRETEDRTVILAGLEEGQQVVASGQFLLDSEASLRGLTAAPTEMFMPSVPALHEAEGTVVGIEDDMIFLDHGPFPTLNMPGMTMGFPLADPALTEGLQEDDRVRVGVRESDEGLTIEAIEKLEAQP
ncbi:efflux RND transporter periplasmic adaptor subunit [Halopseudomonas sp.]|uniref:efflux RND transporter periplasmic adaptor subunit n=1 Tax=Halopseudomonas sp. TaxID=2901191 RepID=UPI0030017894|tara:strand:+ start:2171 stop:3604 length:1434 start_codon:yes stop_codon:yes gene_type:complete